MVLLSLPFCDAFFVRLGKPVPSEVHQMAGFSRATVVFLSPVKSISNEDQLGKIIAHLYLWFFHPFRPCSGHSLELYFKQHRIQLPNKHI